MNGAHTLLGHLIALQAIRSPRARRQARHEWRMDAILADRVERIWYADELHGVVQYVQAGTLEELRTIRHELEFRQRHRGDAAPPTVEEVVAKLASKFGRLDLQARRLAKEAARRNAASVDRRLAREVKRSIGADVSRLFEDKGGPLATAMETAARENVALITSIPEKYLGQVKDLVSDAWVKGARWENLVEDIAQLNDSTETRAALIARDQTSKMNAAFNEARQTQVGIQEYDWSGVLDERERPSHRLMEGVRCRWDAPPTVDGEAVHPGFPVNCRCGARPVFSMLEQREAA